jgi:hypothetical protein
MAKKKGIDHCPECGCVLIKRRSPQLHRYFFATIKSAYDNWPESHEFQPTDTEHLRAWLECKAGHRDVIEEPIVGTGVKSKNMIAFMARVQATRIANGAHYMFFAGRDSPSAVIALVPRSISFSNIGDDEFRPIAEKVFDIIDEAIGKDFCVMARQGLI